MDVKWLWEYAMGIHSNIPICCVVYFCNVWIPMYSNGDRERFSRWDTGANYIRCPECYSKDKKVKIHRCKPDVMTCFGNDLNKALYPAPYKHEILKNFDRELTITPKEA